MPLKFNSICIYLQPTPSHQQGYIVCKENSFTSTKPFFRPAYLHSRATPRRNHLWPSIFNWMKALPLLLSSSMALVAQPVQQNRVIQIYLIISVASTKAGGRFFDQMWPAKNAQSPEDKNHKEKFSARGYVSTQCEAKAGNGLDHAVAGFAWQSRCMGGSARKMRCKYSFSVGGMCGWGSFRRLLVVRCSWTWVASQKALPALRAAPAQLRRGVQQWGVRRGTAPFLSHGNARWVMVTSVLDKDLCDGVSWLSWRMLPRVVPQEHHTGVSYEVNFLPWESHTTLRRKESPQQINPDCSQEWHGLFRIRGILSCKAFPVGFQQIISPSSSRVKSLCKESAELGYPEQSHFFISWFWI